MADMSLMVRIGAIVDGGLDRALNGLNNDLNRMGSTTDRLTARQQRLGSILSRSLARPHADLGRLRQQYERIGRVINDITNAQNRLNRSIERSRRITELQGVAGGNAATSVAQLTAFALPVGFLVKQAAEFKDQVIDLSITAGWSANEQTRISKIIKQSAMDFNQTTADINQGLGILVAGGISSADELAAFAPKLTQATTAMRASWEDLGATTIALRDNLGIGAAGWDRSMNMLATAGKAGQFEVKDMAKWLPSLTPYYQALGIQGEKAVAEIGASLQIARKGAGSADEAANNMRNFLSKLTSPDTLKDFDKAGIDLKTSMQNLVAQGMTPMQAMLGVITEYMGTKSPQAAAEFNKAMAIKDDKERQMAIDRLAEAYKLGELFQDQQAMSFIRPMLSNKDEYNRIHKDSLAGAGQDVMGQDFKARMQSPTEQFKNVKIQFTDLVMTIGEALLPAISETLTAIKPMISGFANWAKQNPQLVVSIVKIVGGLLLAKAAFWGIGFVVMSIIRPISGAVTLFHDLKAGIAVFRGMAILGTLSPRAMMFARALRFIGTAFQALRVILMANPLGLAIGLLIIAATLIYKNWTPIKAFFLDLWTKLKAFANSGVQNILTTIASFSPIGLFIRAWSAVLSYFSGLVPRFAEYGSNIIQGLINGVTAKFGELKAKMSQMASEVSGVFKGALGIHSPSRVFMGFGRNIAEGVAIGIGQQTPTAIKASDAMAQRLSQTEYSNKILAKPTTTASGAMGAGTIHFSPNIHINGAGGDVSAQVQQGLQASYREFVAMLERVERDRNRRAFA
ncbi:phage tail tape measure protein [Acinetobacter sp. c3-l95]|uniref:phage tail tape measure protein n=1 Tax=Acinetobacter sp. c3-l95 TaxID=3342804 RepID=UPI0035B8F47C